jgi:5-methylcytosine-specific restriction endonuclease McrA
MSRKKTSKIWEIPKNEFQQLLDTSDNIVDVLRKIGINPYSGNHKTVHSRVRHDNLSLVKLKENRVSYRAKHLSEMMKLPDEIVFCENSKYNDTKGLKKRLLNEGVEYKCVECGVGKQYNGKSLSLQLDHKNGVSTDNRRSNLRFLCPNCHSQTATFGTKRFRKNKIYETQEERSARIEKTRKFNPSKEELMSLIGKVPMTQIGKKYGVSDRAVRKRCELFGINWKT